MTCAEIKDRTIDYLYRDLPERERSTFEAHLAGCDACRAEVEGLQGTLTRARVAVKALDEAPPARVRVAVLEAAARAARPALAASTGAAAAAMPARSDGGTKAEAGAPEGEGFWSWLRKPWLVPIGVAACAVAVFVVARDVITNPATLELSPPVQKEASPVLNTPVAAPGLAPVVAAEPPAEEASADEGSRQELRRELAKAPRPSKRGRGGDRPASVAAGPPAREYAQPPPGDRKNEMDDSAADEGGLLGGGGRRDDADRSTAGAGVGSGVGGLANATEERKAERRPASPAPKPASPAMEAEAASAPGAQRVRASAPASPPPPPAAAPAPTAARRGERASDERLSASRSESDAEQALARAAAKSKKTSMTPLEELADKADRQFKAARWSEAAGSYRELLRLYPRHADVASWKGRLRACEQALAR